LELGVSLCATPFAAAGAKRSSTESLSALTSQTATTTDTFTARRNDHHDLLALVFRALRELNPGPRRGAGRNPHRNPIELVDLFRDGAESASFTRITSS